MVHSPRDYSDRRDPQAIQRFVLESLERCVERFRQHQRPELIEAFVILGDPSSPMLHTILEDPRHPCYVAVINTLTTSNSTGLIERLLNALQSESTSLNVLNVISKRNDKIFIDHLLEYTNDEIPAKVVKNLERIHSFAWFQPSENGLENFCEEDQARLVRLVAVSGVKQDELLDLLETVLKNGGPKSRRAACEALASIQGVKANQILLDTLYDSDPNIQVACVRQLRDRHLAGTKSILIQMVDSPHEVVREAARESLSEFTLANFLAGYESMSDDARRITAMLVKKVDLKIALGLCEELGSQSRKRRMRAIELAERLEVVPDVADKLIELLEDEDHMIRAAAAEILQYCPTAEAQEALLRAATDRSPAVQNAANSSLAVLSSFTIPANSLSPVEDTV